MDIKSPGDDSKSRPTESRTNSDESVKEKLTRHDSTGTQSSLSEKKLIKGTKRGILGNEKSYFASSTTLDTDGENRIAPNIVQLASHRYSRLGRFLLCLSPISFVVSTAATAFYLFVRASYLVKAQKATGRPFVSACIFFAYEAITALWICK